MGGLQSYKTQTNRIHESNMRESHRRVLHTHVVEREKPDLHAKAPIRRLSGKGVEIQKTNQEVA